MSRRLLYVFSTGFLSPSNDYAGADGLQEYQNMFPDVDPSDLVVASGMSCDEVRHAVPSLRLSLC